MLNRICESDPRTLSIFSTYNSIGIKPVVNPTFPVKDNKLPSSKSILPHARNDNIWDEDRKQMKAFFLQFRFTSKDYAAAKIYWTVDTCCLTGSRYRYIYLYTYIAERNKRKLNCWSCSDQNCVEIVSRKFSGILVCEGWRREGGFWTLVFRRKKRKKTGGYSVEDPTLRHWKWLCEKRDTN